MPEAPSTRWHRAQAPLLYTCFVPDGTPSVCCVTLALMTLSGYMSRICLRGGNRSLCPATELGSRPRCLSTSCRPCPWRPLRDWS